MAEKDAVSENIAAPWRQRRQSQSGRFTAANCSAFPPLNSRPKYFKTLVVRNKSLMPRQAIDTRDANHRESVWQSLEKLDITDQLAREPVRSAELVRECLVRRTDAGGRHCNCRSTHQGFFVSDHALSGMK